MPRHPLLTGRARSKIEVAASRETAEGNVKLYEEVGRQNFPVTGFNFAYWALFPVTTVVLSVPFQVPFERVSPRLQQRNTLQDALQAAPENGQDVKKEGEEGHRGGRFVCC